MTQNKPRTLDMLLNLEGMRLEYEALKADCDRLAKALEFYADPNLYVAYDNQGYGDISKAGEDSGKLAREALAPAMPRGES